LNVDKNKPLSDVVIPSVFLHSLCAPLVAINHEIWKALNFNNQPVWIVCVDEAEFLEDCHMLCLSKLMRSDSKHIALKIADLPFYHNMSQLGDTKLHATVGNDYRLTIVELNESEFKKLSNTLCYNKLRQYFPKHKKSMLTLENFLGKVGNDEYIDYFRERFEKDATDEKIRAGITESISIARQKTAKTATTPKVIQQSIYRKLAPIYYLREMYRISKIGNTNPGWYAGAKMVRKIAEGNPRLFLRIMDVLCEKALKTTLTSKMQNEAILSFAQMFCAETKSLEMYGLEVYENTRLIAEKLRSETHDGLLKESGTTFRINKQEFARQREWLPVAIANSRINVDMKSLHSGLSIDSEFSLSNIYATLYWIPMRRNGNVPRISIQELLDDNESKTKSRVYKSKPKQIPGQTAIKEIDV